MNCPLCGGKGEHVGILGGVEMRECSCSGRILLSQAWTAEQSQELKEWYSFGGYHQQEQEAQGMASPESRDTEYLCAAYERLKAYRGRIPSSGRLMDVGCGCGAFVAMAEAAGYDAAGLELGADQQGFARKLGRVVHKGGWEDVWGWWDAILLLDVFEHLTDPSGCLYHLKQHLTPKGVLVIEFPEWGCTKSREEGLGWRHVKPRQHLFLPDEQAARTLFVRNGLRVITVDRPRRGTLEKVTFFLESV